VQGEAAESHASGPDAAVACGDASFALVAAPLTGVLSAPFAGSKGRHDGQRIRRALPASDAISASGIHRYARAEMVAPSKVALMDCRGPTESDDGNNADGIAPYRRYRSGSGFAATAGSDPMDLASRHRLLAASDRGPESPSFGMIATMSFTVSTGGRGRRESHPPRGIM
jgi:hypothetical protein